MYVCTQVTYTISTHECAVHKVGSVHVVLMISARCNAASVHVSVDVSVDSGGFGWTWQGHLGTSLRTF